MSRGWLINFALLMVGAVCVGAFGRARRSPGAAKAPHDRSSMWLGMAHLASLAAAVVFPWTGWGQLSLPRAVAFTGYGVQVLGFALQLWAMVTLRDLYTLSLQARTGEELVVRGPYRMVRHPGYLAQLIVWFGFALGTRNVAVIAVVVLADLASYRHRIRVEERLLLASAGEAYGRYARRTKRLLPGLW